MMFVAELYAADKVRIGVSNYNISNLTVGLLDGLRKSMNLRRQVPPSEVADLAPLFRRPAELGLRK